MRSSLTIPPTPFRSSHLTIPPSPFTPKLPISSPPQRNPQAKPPAPKVSLTVPPPPVQPLKWLWQCHQCARVYHLGTTRRCLDDGHYFCAGAPVTKRDRKTGLKVTRKSRACASEFDYQGWKTWGVWRRDVAEQREAAEALAAFGLGDDDDEKTLRIENVDKVVPRPLFSQSYPAALFAASLGVKKDCWNSCDYPSECRWGKQFGQQQTQQQKQAAVVLPSTPIPPPPPPPPPPASMVNEPAARDLDKPSKSFDSLVPSLPSTIEEVVESDLDPPVVTAHSHEESHTALQETTKKPTFDDLLASAKRRKRRSASPPPSPLASNPPSPTEEEGQAGTSLSRTVSASSSPAAAHSLQKAFDDFELDVRKSIGRASVLLGGFVNGLSLKSVGLEEERKAEAFVKGDVAKKGHARKKSLGREGGLLDEEGDGQSLSD
ncbi:hypothetical protein Q7P37_004976 [Cladosporium fusiforme]